MAIYHLSANTVTGAQSAEAKADYCGRVSRYTQGRDEIVALESGNMPSWATARARSPRAGAAASAYWRAADRHERANGRRAKHIRIALPRELPLDDQVALARAFAVELATTSDGPLPYTLAVDAGGGHNPHADILISERINDGHDRTPEQWFRRAAAQRGAGRIPNPAEGGARKTAALKPKPWLEQTRELWAKRANAALESAGERQRIDHRSYARQNKLTVPGIHIGPGSDSYRHGRQEVMAAIEDFRCGDDAALDALQDRYAVEQIRVGIGNNIITRVLRECQRVTRASQTALDKARQRFRASASKEQKEQIVDEVTKKRAEGALEALRPESRAVLLDASQRDFEAAVGRYITWCEHYEHDPSDPEAAGEHVAALRELQSLHQAADRHDPLPDDDDQDEDGPRLR